MSPGAPGRTARPYDNARRLAQARLTELAVVDAARGLFIADGYTATTIAAVARAAGVAPQTVYKAFGTKAALLKRVYDVTLVGDVDAVPLADRPEFAAVRERGRRPVGVARLRPRGARAPGPPGAPGHGAARGGRRRRPRPAGLRGDDRRRAADRHRRVAARLADLGALRRGLSVERAVTRCGRSTACTCGGCSPQDRGWTSDEYEAWVADAMIGAVVEPEP